MYLTPNTEKLAFISSRSDIKASQNKKESLRDLDAPTGFMDASGSIYADESALLREKEKAKQKNVKSIQLDRILGNNLNGSWDLIFSMVDKKPYAAKRYEIGDVRQIFQLDIRPFYKENNNENLFLVSPEASVEEIIPVFWGMSTTSKSGLLSWNGDRFELTVSMKKDGKSSVPSQSISSNQTYQVMYYFTFFFVKINFLLSHH